MNKNGFNLYEHFPTEIGFHFFQEIEKMGFKRLDNPSTDSPTCYEGVIYDYFSAENIVIRIIQEEKCFQGIYQKEISIWKKNGCVYKGLIPSSHFAFQIIMSHLFPSKEFAQKIEKEQLDNIYEEDMRNTTDYI